MEMTMQQQMVFAFLRENSLMTLSTITSEGKIHAVPVYIYVDDAFGCYCFTKDSTQKLVDVIHNPRVTLSAYDEHALIAVEVIGDASMLLGPEQTATVRAELLKIIESRNVPYQVPPVDQIGGEYVYIAVEPKEVSYINYATGSAIPEKPRVIQFTLE